MTKKDYILIARAIKIQKTTMDKIDFKILVSDMIDILQEDNPRFNREKFLQACGIK